MTKPLQRPISAMRLRAATAALVLAAVLGPTVVATQSVQAQTFTVLYNFTGGSDGRSPYSALIDVNGNLYGTTKQGGASGYGTVFKVDSSGTETVLHSFTFTDGGYPFGRLLRDAAGNLYGTTKQGGTSGYGTVFKLDTSGTETVLYSFTGGADGADPYSGLVRDTSGNLYGTTYGQSPFNHSGTVFEVDTSGTETALHSFTPGTDGTNPLYGSLIRDAAGNLYGTTLLGGTSGYGTVFKLDASGTETVLHNFTPKAGDGLSPSSGLVRDAAGNLYGTTYAGGTHNFGTVFKVDASGTETVLYSFAGGTDGAYPIAGLVPDTKGNFYGTTYMGGTANDGTVFKVNGKGKETVLHSFNNSSDGGYPYASLVRDTAGNLYGTAVQGGTGNYGTVFKLAP